MYEHEGVPLYGYVSDPKVSESVREIADRYLSSSSNKYDLIRAEFFAVFIAPKIVSEGKFVDPFGLEPTEETIDIFASHKLSNEGCNVGRINATNEDEKGDYFIWLVHGGKYEGVDGIESCLLFAAAAAAGVGLQGNPKMQANDLQLLLDALILGIR
ncbi:hypothetical protein [Ruegeria atlantica]|uniref:hypothetical protein n=1 Tax=Ruegeria atlantica TaxID=81569 RepID=UPI001C2B9D07|nr:hypothetical protein [Ruegeria atlantica]